MTEAKNNVPKLTNEQRRAASLLGVQFRQKQAEVLRRLKAGELSYEELIYTEDEDFKKIKVIKILKTLPGIGDMKAREIMKEIKISEIRRIQGLGHRQRKELVRFFNSRKK